MASKRNVRRRACQGKKSLTKAEAFGLAVKLRNRNGAHMDAYPCPHCHAWHVGHRPRAIQKKINKRRTAR